MQQSKNRRVGDLQKSGLSIVIPAYNEENAALEILEQLHNIMNDVGVDYEVIVVDDCSTDRTFQIIKESKVDVVLFQHRKNRGYGAAIKTGLRHARFDTICITDADGTYPNERIPDLLERMKSGNKDMVVGARTGESVAVPLVRKPAKWALGKLANYISGEPIPDINSGLRIFTYTAAMRFVNLFPDGFSLTTTITVAMLSNGYIVDFIPINYHMRVGRSKIRPIRDTLNFIYLILRMGLYFSPIKVFIPVGFISIFLGIFFGLVSYFIFDRLADVSTLVLVTAGLQIMAIGLLAELINSRIPSRYREEE